MRTTEVVWAAVDAPGLAGLAEVFYQQLGYRHWSRGFEYPWIAVNGDFAEGQAVLDAGGGDSPLQFWVAERVKEVVNVDLEGRFPKRQHPNVRNVKGDIRTLECPDNSFDRIMCVSVLEHVRLPDLAVVTLLRKLKPGGLLLVTMDVASYVRWNHTIDEHEAGEILGLLGLRLPPEPPDLLTAALPEIERGRFDPEQVVLRVLCFKFRKR